MSDSTSQKTLDYVGALEEDEEGAEKLAVHASLLLSVLGALCDLDVTHTSLPWKVACGLDVSLMPGLLEYMEAEWYFVTSVVDHQDPKDQLWKLLSHTRWQVYRDVMTKAE